MAAAYGIAVTGTMVMTTCLAFVIVHRLWGWSLPVAIAFIAPFLALDLEDHRHLHPAAGLEFNVRIDEWPVQAPGKQPRNRGLACAHHADKENVFAVFHDVIVSEKTKAGVNPA